MNFKEVMAMLKEAARTLTLQFTESVYSRYGGTADGDNESDDDDEDAEPSRCAAEFYILLVG